LLLGGWAGYALFGLAFPYQYVTHEYYHLPLVALTSLSLMPVIDQVLKQMRPQPWLWRLGGAAVILAAASYSLYVARSVLLADNYRNEPTAWARVGEAIPNDASFVALTADYGMRLRYYGWRTMAAAWPSTGDLNLLSLHGNEPLNVEAAFAELSEGKDYFLVTAFSELEAQPELKQILFERYPVFEQGDGYILFDLHASEGKP